MKDRFKSFIKNVGIFMVGSFGSKILSFIMIPIYTSVLSTSQYGQIDIVTTTNSLLFPLITLGMSEAIFRFIMIKDIDNRKVLSNATVIISVSYCISVCLASLINYIISWKYMGWMLGILFSSILYDLLSNYLKAVLNTKEYVAIGLYNTFVNLLCNVYFIVYLNLGVEGFLFSIIISNFSASIIVLLKQRLYVDIRLKYFDFEIAKRMIRYSFPLIFSSLSWWVVTSSDRYMIRFFMSDSDVGIYSIASKIPLILQSIISIIQTVWQISTNELHDNCDKSELVENFVFFMRLFRQIGFISGSFLLLLTKPIMRIIAKNDFYYGWKYTPFLILSIVFSFATGMVATLYGAYEKNQGVLYSVLGGGIINILLNIIFIPFMGVLGATISTAISRLFIAVYRLKDTEKLLRFDREYTYIFINGFVISLQCISLIVSDEFVYLKQMVYIIIICVINRQFFLRGIRYIEDTIKRKRNA